MGHRFGGRRCHAAADAEACACGSFRRRALWFDVTSWRVPQPARLRPRRREPAVARRRFAREEAESEVKRDHDMTHSCGDQRRRHLRQPGAARRRFRPRRSRSANAASSTASAWRSPVRRPTPAGSRAVSVWPAAKSARRPSSARESVATAASAALLNGSSGHALDFDDTQLSTTADRIFGLLTHPTMPPMTAALAVGERQHATGRQFLEAFLTGFEVECKISEAIHPHHYKQGFHSSGTVGTFGAMAATAKLLGLTPEQCAHALAIAASLASGIRVNFGTMTKPLHVGRAAQNGVLAAEWAADGFTGGGGRARRPVGLLQGVQLRQRVRSRPDCRRARQPTHDRVAGRVDQAISVRRAGPSEHGRHARAGHDARRQAGEIKAIRLRAGSNILNPLRYKMAKSELEAKFCPPFMLASIALQPEGRHPRVHRRVRAERAGAADDGESGDRARSGDRGAGFERIRSTVEVDLVDGRTLVQEADERYRGGPERPFTRDELMRSSASARHSCWRRRRCQARVRSRRVDREDGRHRRAGRQLLTRTPVSVAVNLAWVSIAALVIAVTLSCVTTINVGLLSLALAIIIGVYLGGMPLERGARGFPGPAVHHARQRDAAVQHRRVERHARAADRARRAAVPRPRRAAARHVLRAWLCASRPSAPAPRRQARCWPARRWRWRIAPACRRC